jgi:hypothetical protein
MLLERERKLLPGWLRSFSEKEKTGKSSALTILMGDKYLLHIINEIINKYGRSLKRPCIYL